MSSLIFKTPNSLQRRQGPVFKTPMTFSPRLAGEQAKPSPSRYDLWKEELGLDESEINGKLDFGSSSGEEEGEQQEGENNKGTCSLIEYRVLQKELEERNSQRDDLLLRIKSLSDKNKQYKNRIQKEETNKKQQIKIMRKTYEAHLEEKQNLVKNLEDIIEEQESKIFMMESENKGIPVTDLDEKPTAGVSRLIQQIEQLQQEKTDLTSQYLTSQCPPSPAAENGSECNSEDVEKLTVKVASLEQEKMNLEYEVVKLRTSQSSGTTDNEKQLQKLEQDNDRLQKTVKELKRQLVEDKENSANLQNFQKESLGLKEKVVGLETSLGERNRQITHNDIRHREQIQKLTEENLQISKELRELGVSMTALQAQEPQVVTKVEHVEVESTEATQKLRQGEVEKQELQEKLTSLEQANISNKQQLTLSSHQISSLEKQNNESKHQLTLSSQQISTLEKQNNENKQQLTLSSQQISSLENKLKAVEQEMDVVQSQLMSEIDAIQKSKAEALSKAELEAETRVRSLHAQISSIRGSLSSLQPTIRALFHDYGSLKKQAAGFPAYIQNVIKKTSREVTKAIGDISDYNKDLVRKYRKEMQLRKKYHNELVELKGNIRVFCRVRPAIKEDGNGPMAEHVVNFDPDDQAVVQVTNKGRLQTFEMDRVFTAASTQEEVFAEVQQLVTSSIDGYNVCIFAYGQTGSGKTYTMEGPPSDAGINQRALRELFRETQERSKDWEYSISVNVLEIYNEMIRDLLSDDPTFKLDVKMNPDGGFHVPGLSSVKVESVEDVNGVFRQGRINRSTASTNMNEHSSRSHALLCITLVGRNKTTAAKTTGKLNLVDLAGSERVSKSGADGTRLKEAQNINKSLSSLGDVIHALRSKQSHVPYRNSKLTYLLQDSLGGDSKTLMILQVAPVEKNVGETICSLNFGQRVRSVELGAATRKTENAEMAELRDRLAQYEDGSSPTKPKSYTPNKPTRRK